jgi:RNA polymerase sigma-70 factor (ECF subfamily)
MALEYDFNKIHDEYYQNIVQYVTRIVGPNDAEDITQDVFDKISRGLGGFQGKSKLSTWIYRIATNTAIDRIRSSAQKHSIVQTSQEDIDSNEDLNAWNGHKATLTDNTVIRKEMSECVKEFIDNLPQDYKTVIILSELENLANQEIADILDISLDNVKVRLHRARAKLKEALGNGCDFYQNEHNILACDRKQSNIFPKIPR